MALPVVCCKEDHLFTNDPEVIREFRAFQDAREEFRAFQRAREVARLEAQVGMLTHILLLERVLRANVPWPAVAGEPAGSEEDDEEDDGTSTVVPATQGGTSVLSQLGRGEPSVLQGRECSIVSNCLFDSYANDAVVAQLTPAARSQMSIDEVKEWTLFAEELHQTADQENPDARAKSVSQYTHKATHYLDKLAIGRVVHRMQLFDEDSRNSVSFSPPGRDLFETAFVEEHLLRLMRGLDFIGRTPTHGPTMAARRVYIFKKLRVEPPTVPTPLHDETAAMARYRMWRKLRKLGERLEKGGLVEVMIAKSSGRMTLRWAACCDKFSDPDWRYTGDLPRRDEPSAFPTALPVGFMLYECERPETQDVAMAGTGTA